jgi:hypothetical protein
MSTGIVIKSASYGVGSTNVDVTSQVTSKIIDGVLNLPVGATALGVDDLAPGQLKTLTIQYSINGGDINSLSEKDGGTISISAPSERSASGLQITKAEYGYPGNYQDVTDAVQNYLKPDGSVNFKVGFQEVGLPDPNPAKQKQLNVEYTVNGSKNTKKLKDGETWKMNAPAVEDASSKKSILKGAFDPLSFFIQVVIGSFIFVWSNLTTQHFLIEHIFGKEDINKWVNFALGCIPLFPVWGIPWYTFFNTMWNGTFLYKMEEASSLQAYIPFFSLMNTPT